MKADEMRILMLEDNPTEAKLVELELRNGGIVFELKRVETRNDFISQLEEFKPQVILADFKLPAFTGMEAFGIIKEKGLDVPFIILSGTLGEDLAIEILKAGVTDYILKGNLSRLVPAVNRALADTKFQNERKQAEEALRESEEKYRALIETTNTGFVIIDLAGKVLDANDEYARLTGHERRDEILGRSVVEWTAEYDRERNATAVEQCVQQGFVRNLELDYAVTHGQIIPVESNATLVTAKNGPQILALCHDITERKRAEENLLRIQAAVESAGDAIGLYTPHGVHFYHNQSFTDLFGYSIEELHKPLGPTILYADAMIAREVFKTIMQGNPWRGEIMMVAKSGRQFPVILRANVIKDDKGNIIGLIGIHTDITVRKRTGKALQESEKKYSTLFETSTDAIMMLTRDGFFDGNQATLDLFEFSSKEDFVKMHPSELSPPTQPDGKDSLIASLQHIETAFAKGSDFFEWVHKKKDGTLFSAEVRLSSLKLDEKKVLQALVCDITERKQAEQQMLSLQSQLQQSQKMEAIGQLAGGVAHDFNNLLTVISVQAQLALRGLLEGDPLKEKLKDIEQAADRAANLTRQLLAFSRRQILEMKVINLNVILMDMGKMLKRVIGEDIEFKTQLAEDLGLVKADPGQMEQVILNLAVNAKDAMPQGGKLFLETANVELDQDYTRSHLGVVPGAYVLLSVIDTGIGMSMEVKEQIFDPFFTTKEKGKGTGLGLSTVYGIVKQSGGDIYVYSEPNKGTTFKIYLPRVFELPEALKKETREEVPRGRERILVVEDSPIVRRLAVEILRKQGYRVLEANEGGEALVMCEKDNDPIDLILTDIVMPNIGGPELIERLRQVRKDFKVLYMTGYTDEKIVNHGVLVEGIELIHKPFTIQKLAQKVREVLDKNSESSI